MEDGFHKQLAAAITLQAVKDYVNGRPKKQQQILSDLKSKYMDFITNGFSLIVAEQLERHPNEIAERLRIHHEMV